MKWIPLVLMLCLMCLPLSVEANTTLTVGKVTLIIPGGPCWDDTAPVPPPPTASASFTLAGVTGTGKLTSQASTVIDNIRHGDHSFYIYSLDLSAMSAATNHCVKLLIHFGPPLGCAYDVLVLTNGTGVHVTSATLSSVGDVNLSFGTGDCLLPGKIATDFGMLSDTQPTTGSLTIIDDWTDANGQAKQSRVSVRAIVPDVPPVWVYPIQFPYSLPVPYPIFQGSINNYCNSIPMLPPNGLSTFTLQLLDGTNGLPVSPVITQSVKVANGLFTTPLPFDPAVFMGNNPLWLNLSFMPPNGNSFIPLSPPLPITPAPQALYAYSAGVVADLSPGQAVTSLNGLRDDVTLAAGTDVILGTNGNTLIISAVLGSDRNIKTGFLAVEPEDILARLIELPIQSWRFTNEVASTRHLGPTAQDFKATFGLGTSDTSIRIVDEGGVALSAIQGLNHKLEAELKAKDAAIEELRMRLEQLEAELGRQTAPTNSRSADTFPPETTH
jgi:hypothetical protein